MRVREAADHEVTLLTHGVMVNEVLAAAELLAQKGVRAQVYKVNEISPALADAFDAQAAALSGRLVVVEDVVDSGSLGEWVASHRDGVCERRNTGDRRCV